MKLKIAGLSVLLSSGVFAGEPLFKVDSSQEGLNIPYQVCADGVNVQSCYKFTAYGKQIFIQSKSNRHPVFTNAGILLHVPGYKINGCSPYGNGYCLFAVSNSSYAQLSLN